MINILSHCIADTENEIDDDDQNYKIILKRLIKLERVS